MLDFRLSEAIELLERTPRTLESMLAGVSRAWALARESDDTWSPTDIIAHLIHGERTDWIPRLEVILQYGERRPFTPFDRSGHRDLEGTGLDELLRLFAELRARNLQRLGGLALAPEHLERVGRHPELGPVTLRALLATWTVHDLNHLNQITRALASRYRDDVGPWNDRRYLRILDGD